MTPSPSRIAKHYMVMKRDSTFVPENAMEGLMSLAFAWEDRMDRAYSAKEDIEALILLASELDPPRPKLLRFLKDLVRDLQQTANACEAVSEKAHRCYRTIKQDEDRNDR